MNKTLIAVALGLFLAGCNSNNPNKGEPQEPPVLPVEPLATGLYLSNGNPEVANCGIAGVRYFFQDAEGTVLGEELATAGNGFIDVSEAPEAAKYVTYEYDLYGDHWDVVSVELALVQGPVALNLVRENLAVTCDGVIADAEKRFELQNDSVYQDVALDAFGLLSQGESVAMRENGSVLLRGFNEQGVAGSELLDSSEIAEGERVSVMLETPAIQLTFTDAQPDSLISTWAALPFTSSVQTPVETGQAYVVAPGEGQTVLSMSFDDGRDRRIIAREVAEGAMVGVSLPEMADLATDYPFIRCAMFGACDVEGANLTTLSFDAEAYDGDKVAHYSARYFNGPTGTPMATVVYRHVYAMAQDGQFFVPPMSDSFSFPAANAVPGVGIVAQSFALIDSAKPQHVWALTGGEFGQANDSAPQAFWRSMHNSEIESEIFQAQFVEPLIGVIEID
ncbi:hypothetical protein [Ferrimonas pelagia]|uniref:Uncharacterized protein n=1 Tax=Ferrimonas pelagia TaxID=1177826 RepID=A0ABP9FB55_9GAMM